MSAEPGIGWKGPPPREICIVMLSALGDTVHVLPVANALKRAWPETRITWVIQPIPYQLVSGHPAIDEFVVFERTKGLKAWHSFRDVTQVLGNQKFDLLLGLQVYLKAGILTALIQSKVKLGFDRARARDMQWLFTNRRIPQHAPQHVQDQYFEFLHFIGVNPKPSNWDLQLSDSEKEAQAAFFSRIGKRTCAVVVATSKRAKNWTSDGYARVLEEVESTHGLTPVIIGGPSTVERAIAHKIMTSTKATVLDTLGNNIRKLVWILEGSSLLISPDTGPLHISRALGTPVVSLFGHTNPNRSGPYRAFRDLIVNGYEQHSREEYPAIHEYRDGMKHVTVDNVLEKVSLALERYLITEEEVT